MTGSGEERDSCLSELMEHVDLAPTRRDEQAPPLQTDGVAARGFAVRLAMEHLDLAPTKREGQAPPLQMHEGSGGRFGVRVALVLLSCYKAYLSPVFAGTCKFEPTCSRYAYEAIERYGVLRGGWLGLRRLARCQPLSRKFGWDPVPEKWEAMRAKAEMMDKTGEVRP